MTDSPKNILREAADRLIQTAEYLGRVGSLSLANSAASSLSISELALLFGYRCRPIVADNVRSRGTSARGRARGRSNSSVPHRLHQRGLTWSISFVLLGLQQPNTSTYPKPTGYGPANKSVSNLKEALLRKWHLIQSYHIQHHFSTANFREPPLISFKRENSLRHARESKKLIQQNYKRFYTCFHAGRESVWPVTPCVPYLLILQK